MGETINNFSNQVFICFAAEDRYKIVESITYHLKNYGITTWYDRYTMVLGDNRQEKNLDEGAGKCKYALTLLSKHTEDSACAMEELSIIESRYHEGEITVFPVLYELLPSDIPAKLRWINALIFKEVDRHSGTREICNHIACKITGDVVGSCNYKKIQDIICAASPLLPPAVNTLLHSYLGVDYANLNSRITLLYATYVTIAELKLIEANSTTSMVSKIFGRLFSEAKLNLAIDYRDLWLLENSICILVEYYIAACTESKI